MLYFCSIITPIQGLCPRRRGLTYPNEGFHAEAGLYINGVSSVTTPAAEIDMNIGDNNLMSFKFASTSRSSTFDKSLEHTNDVNSELELMIGKFAENELLIRITIR